MLVLSIASGFFFPEHSIHGPKFLVVFTSVSTMPLLVLMVDLNVLPLRYDNSKWNISIITGKRIDYLTEVEYLEPVEGLEKHLSTFYSYVLMPLLLS